MKFYCTCKKGRGLHGDHANSSPLLQVEAALKVLSRTVLLDLCEAAPQTPHIAPVRAQGLALYTQLVLQERGVVSIAPALQVASKGLESVAALHCQLALAQLYLSQRKVTPLFQIFRKGLLLCPPLVHRI